VEEAVTTVASQVREAGREALLIGTLTMDTVLAAVEAAFKGALVIARLPVSDGSPFGQLVDLMWAAQDWELRPKFDAVL
jgi:hypothetical protein